MTADRPDYAPTPLDQFALVKCRCAHRGTPGRIVSPAAGKNQPPIVRRCPDCHSTDHPGQCMRGLPRGYGPVIILDFVRGLDAPLVLREARA